MKSHDVVVVGSGPNGLSAAITMAQAGLSVLVLEAGKTPGGGARTESLTRTGFHHDVCSAIHPLAITSPFFNSLPLEKFGLTWIHSPVVLAHPLDHQEALLLHHSIEDTARGLGQDGETYLRLMGTLTKHWEDTFSEILNPIFHWPRYPFLMARFGLKALTSAEAFVQRQFQEPETQALFSGIAAHANAPLGVRGTTAIGLILNLAAHAKGWPLPKGGAQKITDSLLSYLRHLGGEIQTETEVRSLKDLPKSRWVFFDLTPRQILSILGDAAPSVEKKRWSGFSYGPGVFKMDWALSQPIPWRSKNCLKAATVHLGGSWREIATSENAPAMGKVSNRPFVLLTQPSLFDSTRAPQGQHTAWAYCHVPFGFMGNCREIIENQIERFAPGFRDIILARSELGPQDLQRKNANLVGGDISGGGINLKQLLFRPGLAINPYRMSMPGFYICSSSTPPGPGVHGMCGFNAARSALQERS